METMKICEILSALNARKPCECISNVIDLLSENIKSCNKLGFEENLKIDKDSNHLDDNPVSTYLILNSKLFNQLKLKFDNENDTINMLSVQQNKIIRDSLKQWLTIGICFNLQPKLPQYLHPPSAAYANEPKTIHTAYDRLCFTLSHCIDLLASVTLRPLLIFEGYQILLNGLYQIVYCPLKPPDGNSVTKELFEKFTKDKKRFQRLLDQCALIIPRPMYVKETMLLMKTDCLWLRRAVSSNLTQILRCPNGLRIIVRALLENSQDYDADDCSKSWKALDVIAKLVISLKSAPDFEANICKQICGLLSKDCAENERKTSAKSTVRRPYEMIFISCTRYFFVDDAPFCRTHFLPLLFDPLRRKFENNDDVTDLMACTMRLLKLAFVNCSINDPALPCSELDAHVTMLFFLLSALYPIGEEGIRNDETISELYDNVQMVLVHYLRSQSAKTLFERVIFADRMLNEEFAFEVISSKLLITSQADKINAANNLQFLSGVLLNMMKDHHDLKVALFLYLIDCLRRKDGDIDKNLLVYNLLSMLAEDTNVQKRIIDDPKSILSYIGDMLISAVERNVHKCVEEDGTNDFQSLFLLIMILQALTAQQTLKTEIYKDIVEILSKIRDECMNPELRQLAISVINALNGEPAKRKEKKTYSRLEEAIQSVCDPLLPIRGHGLMMLAKLVEDNDPEVAERRLFVLNVFQQNLKNDDSFIYLAAISGLAALADSFPECVLSTLIDEYAGYDAAQSEGHELRMKLGEVLLKTTRSLGQKVVKHKALLLNAFMAATKDDDYLMRASSLSNLGEVCRVLGYKLGSIVNEVLDCIHGVIQTDPAIEARRAAVSVVRHLFVGLEKETVSFLKDDIQRVFETLRKIYNEDKDDVMRLHAQLALEELNANVKALLLSNVTLSANVVKALQHTK